MAFTLRMPLEWQVRESQRVPIHDKIWARPFLIKGLLGWTVRSPHVLSSEASGSFLNRANRSGKYPDAEQFMAFPL